MTLRIRSTIVISFIICTATLAWSQQYLYTPQPAPSDQKPPSKDGILVQEIEVQKGDTLYGLSRKFSGRGMYYPQILLFNTIKNPNLIYPGDTLKVPVSHNEASDTDHTGTKQNETAHKPKTSGEKKKTSLDTGSQPAARQTSGASPTSSKSAEISLSDLKAVGTDKNRASRQNSKSAVHAKKNSSQKSPAAKSSSSPLSAADKSAASATPAVDSAAGQKIFEAAVKAYRKDDCRTALELLDRYLADNSGSPLAADATLYKAECYLKLSAQ